MHCKVDYFLVVLEVVLVLLETKPVAASLLGLLLALLHVVAECDFGSALAGEGDEVLEDSAFGEGQHLLVVAVQLAGQPAQDEGERVFALKGNAVVPGEPEPVFSELDVLLSAEPAKACSQHVEVCCEDKLAHENGIEVIELPAAAECELEVGKGDALGRHEHGFCGFVNFIDLDNVFDFAVFELLQVGGQVGGRVLQEFEGDGHLQIDVEGLVDEVGAAIEQGRLRVVAVARAQLGVQARQCTHAAIYYNTSGSIMQPAILALKLVLACSSLALSRQSLIEIFIMLL